jgi:propionyl-CoA carboxylase alpha chain
VIKTARKMGIKTVAVYSDADRNALHVQMADEAVHIGPPPGGAVLYRDRQDHGGDPPDRRRGGASGLWLPVGEPNFAAALEAEGVVFVGPPSPAIEAMGDKITSKKIAMEAGVSHGPRLYGPDRRRRRGGEDQPARSAIR